MEKQEKSFVKKWMEADTKSEIDKTWGIWENICDVDEGIVNVIIKLQSISTTSDTELDKIYNLSEKKKNALEGYALILSNLMTLCDCIADTRELVYLKHESLRMNEEMQELQKKIEDAKTFSSPSLKAKVSEGASQ